MLPAVQGFWSTEVWVGSNALLVNNGGSQRVKFSCLWIARELLLLDRINILNLTPFIPAGLTLYFWNNETKDHWSCHNSIPCCNLLTLAILYYLNSCQNLSNWISKSNRKQIVTSKLIITKVSKGDRVVDLLQKQICITKDYFKKIAPFKHESMDLLFH